VSTFEAGIFDAALVMPSSFALLVGAATFGGVSAFAALDPSATVLRAPLPPKKEEVTKEVCPFFFANEPFVDAASSFFEGVGVGARDVFASVTFSTAFSTAGSTSFAVAASFSASLTGL
jgi:hypothetical protein